MNVQDTVRPSPIAGQWYPGNAKVLAANVDRAIANANLPEIRGEIIAIMAPHAGHLYSGSVAGYAFAAIQKLTPELVTVVSPMHQPYPYKLITSAHRAYHTPLGEIPIDSQAVAELDQYLKDALGFGLTPVAHDQEHSLEIELPFLQRALKNDFKLLPVMVREQSSGVVQALGKGLAEVTRKRNALLVASTDLSHFYPQAIANQFDREILRRVENFDPQGVLSAEDEGKGFACGRGALAAVMWAAQYLGANKVYILNYATSGDITGDYSQVVGYGAAAITRE